MTTQLKNYMENIVIEALDSVLKDFDYCKCERCKMDIAALALNNLPPKYIVAKEIYSKLDILHKQFDIDVWAQIARAADIVGKSPRHN